ncbi:MAG: hypothetical protein Q9227_000994 [Pyrenula ochraceoflavens]
MGGSTGDISRKNLEQHKITYIEEAYDSDQITGALPAHVDALREALSGFSDIIPPDEKELFDTEFEQHGRNISEQWVSLQPPVAAYFTNLKDTLRRQSPRSRTAHENIEYCGEIAVKARGMAQELEAGWTYFLRVNVFGNFDASKDKTLRSEIKLLPGLTKRTIRKPDLTYGFPILSSSEGLPKGFARDSYVQSFSLDVLAKLRSDYVHSTTTKGLRGWPKAKKTTALKAHDLLCYPWAVAEMKHSSVSQSEVEHCYCQAANASAAALTLQEQLLEQAFGDSPEEVLPIIAFTCIGPRVKVWLTYRAEGESGSSTIMRCIWSTSIELTWGVVALRHIVQNMHTWSSRILRPQLGVAVTRVLKQLLQSPSSLERQLRHGPTPPDTPASSPDRTTNRRRSPSIRSHQSDPSNSDDDTTLIGIGAESGSPEHDSDGEEDESRDDDGSDDEHLSDEEHLSGEEHCLSKEEISPEYTDEELENRRRLSPTLLSGAQFAKLDILYTWFEGLPHKQKVNLIWNLLKPFNVRKLHLQLATRKLLQPLLDTLNEALGKNGSEKSALKISNLHIKRTPGRIRHALRNCRSEPETLESCLRRSLCLNDDKKQSVHSIIAKDLETLSDEEREQMEKEAFELLNRVDQQNDQLP